MILQGIFIDSSVPSVPSLLMIVWLEQFSRTKSGDTAKLIYLLFIAYITKLPSSRLILSITFVTAWFSMS